ncbi:MAG: DNA polymerase III subunit beta [Fusobacterium sp.]|nr:DNA polymerase III subunit beta [Fusobacterium sp.]
MHIRVNRQKFLTAMRMVEKSIRENKIKPILSCVYVKVKDNRLYFCGTNLETTIKTSIEIKEVISAGEVAFYNYLLDEYLKEIKDEYITLRVEDNNVMYIETEDSNTEFSVFDAQDYPNNFENINLAEENLKFELPCNELVDIFEKTIFSVDTGENIALNTIRIESAYKHLHFVSTDSYRLTYLFKNISKDIENFAVSVPADTISAFIKILKGAGDKNIKVYQEANHLYFICEDMLMITKLVELRYPNYQSILINSSYDKKLIISVDEFIHLLKRVLIFSRTNAETKNSATYSFEAGQMEISGLNDIAKINEKLEVNFEGENLKISLNIKFLLDFIQNIPKDKNVVLELMQSNSSVKVYEENKDDYVYILMPLALRD